MSNVFQLGRHGIKFPPGSTVHHEHYGWCEVTKAEGLVRTIEVVTVESTDLPATSQLPGGVLSDEILSTEILVSEQFDVHIGELSDWRTFEVKDDETAGTVMRPASWTSMSIAQG